MADRSVVVRLTAIVSGYTASIAQAEGATKQFSASAVASTAAQRSAMNTLGNTALAMGAAIAGGFVLAAKEAMRFQTAMAGVSTTVHATPAQFAALSSGIRKLATEIPVTREGLASVVEESGKLGVATPNLLAFAKSMEQVGASTDISATDAARGLAQLAASTHLPITEVPRLGNVLVALGNDSKASETKILASAQSIAGVGHLIGLTTPQILGFGTAIASLGGSGGSALGITKLFTTISKAVADGGAGLDKFAQLAGMSSTQFAKQFRDNAGAAIVAFLTGLDKVKARGGNALQVLNDLGLGGARGARVIAGLAAQHEQLAHSMGVSSDAAAANNAAAIESAKRWDTTAAKLKELTSQITDVALSFGNALLPVLKSAATDLTPFVAGLDKMVEAFGRLPSPVRDGIVGFGLFASASLLAIGGALKLAVTILKLRDAYVALRGAQEVEAATSALPAAGAAAGAGGAAAGGAGLAGGAGAGALVAGSAAAVATLVAGLIVLKQSIAGVQALMHGGASTANGWAHALADLGGVAGGAAGEFVHLADHGLRWFGVLRDGKSSTDAASASAKDAANSWGWGSIQAARLAQTEEDAAVHANSLAGYLSLIGAASLGSIGGVNGLMAALVNLQGLSIGVSVAQDSAFGAIDTALGSSGGGGGGGGGAAKTMQDTLDAARKIPDAMRAVQDSQGKVISQAFALKDAYLGVADATDQVRRAQQSLADANQAEKEATNSVATAERNLQQVLHGVAAGSRAGVAAKRNATDTGLSLQEAQLGLASAQQNVTSANKGVDEAAAIFGAGTQPYKDAVAKREQANIDLIRAQEAVTDATKAHDQAEKDLSDTLHGAAPGSEKVKKATQALKDARHNLRDTTNSQIDAENGLRDAHENVQKATETLRTAQISMSRAWEDAQRAAEDYKAAVVDAGKAMNGGGGGGGGAQKSAQQLKAALDQAKKSLFDTATNFGDLSGAARGSAKWTKAFLAELTAEKNYADQHYGPNNPLSLWLGSLITSTQLALTNIKGIKDNLSLIDTIFHAPVTITVQGPVGRRASGGPVSAGGEYLVGEHGPELVKFTAAGRVYDHATSMSMLSKVGPGRWDNARPIQGGGSLKIDYGKLAAATRGRDSPLVGNLYALDAQDAIRQVQRVKDREDAIALSF